MSPILRPKAAPIDSAIMDGRNSNLYLGGLCFWTIPIEGPRQVSGAAAHPQPPRADAGRFWLPGALKYPMSRV